MEKDLNHIAKLEKAIKEKYGEEAIQNPKGTWTKEKESKYLKDLKDFYSTNLKKEDTQQKEGFIVKSRITPKEENRVCPVCKKYSMESNDNLYMTKFDCCYECYIKHVQGREQRWKTGWRPNS